MKTSRLLYLSAYQMTAYRWHSGKLTSEGLFAVTEGGHQQFSAYLAQHRKDIARGHLFGKCGIVRLDNKGTVGRGI